MVNRLKKVDIVLRIYSGVRYSPCVIREWAAYVAK